MTEIIDYYYSAVKLQGILKVAFGSLTAVIPILLVMYYYKYRFYQGFMIALVALGTHLLISGRVSYEGADKMNSDMREYFQTDANGFATEATGMIEQNINHIQNHLIVFGVLLLAGIALVVLFRKGRSLVFGLGVGLVLMGLAGVIFDLVAITDATRYLDAIQALME
ncbi:MAG: hypothetical protein KDD36_04545 [Flavobacteriales bacterium]|nr:hypothetical protein [Flavobacteriales bacterium]